MKQRRYILFIIVSFILSLCVFAENPKIRVGINYGSNCVSQANLTFENGFQAGFPSDDNSFMPMMFFPENEATVSLIGGTITITTPEGDVLFEGYEGQPIAISPLESELYGEEYIPFTGIGSIKYPEVLEFSVSSGKLSIINVVDSELYFKGVLPSEVYPSWHEEALKAAAVATRTYTYHSISGKHSKYGFDVCTTTCCQVYSGVTKCKESTNKAVDETRNLVLTYDGKLITAVYHAISGGITESAAGAWGGNPENYPYLTVVKTPFEVYNEISMGHWTKVLYEEDFNNLISASSYNGKISSPISAITLDDDTPGYLNNMTLTDTDGNSIKLTTSSNIRSFFSVISANFTIGSVYMPSNSSGDSATVLTPDGETQILPGEETVYLTPDGEMTTNGIRQAYYIDGKGYGHGVGMSQYGAQYAAKAGYKYDEILGIYYPGAILTDFTQMDK